jgi:hypothetical protein
MRGLLFLVILSISFHASFSQRRTNGRERINTTVIGDYDRIISIDLTIRKIDTFHSNNGSTLQLYSLSISNNTDSSLCILFPFELSQITKGRIFYLDPVIDCSNPSLSYYSLEHSEGWDQGNLPLPSKPVLLNPNTYLQTNFAIRLISEPPKFFHLHYAAVDLTYSQLWKKYAEDIHFWERYLPVRCKEYVLPD